MNVITNKSDYFGVIASLLCMAHCLATPFLFVALASATNIGLETPLWWNSINFILLSMSLLAVYHSAENTNNNLMKRLLWIAWVVLFCAVMNEQFHWLELPELVTYLAASILVILHLYNKRYCQCKGNSCCVNHE